MRLGPLIAILLLSACQLAGPAGKTVADNPVVGDAIEVSTLDAPVEGLAAAEAAVNPETAPDAPLSELAPVGELAPRDDAATDPAPAAEDLPVVIDPAQQTPEALACIRKGGRWTKVGEGEARACVKVTRDGGKRCDADRDCQGVCLARSQTCAPATPLFGCNDVLQDDGRRMTLCLE